MVKLGRIGWQRVLATWESHLLLSLEFLLYWCKSFSCSTPALPHPFLGRGSVCAWQGSTTALPALVRRSLLWSPLVSLVKNADCAQLPLLMLKLRARPAVKNKNQKQSRWTTLIWNCPLPPALPYNCSIELHPLQIQLCATMAVLVWSGNLLGISLCTLVQNHQPPLPTALT